MLRGTHGFLFWNMQKPLPAISALLLPWIDAHKHNGTTTFLPFHGLGILLCFSGPLAPLVNLPNTPAWPEEKPKGKRGQKQRGGRLDSSCCSALGAAFVAGAHFVGCGWQIAGDSRLVAHTRERESVLGGLTLAFPLLCSGWLESLLLPILWLAFICVGKRHWRLSMAREGENVARLKCKEKLLINERNKSVQNGDEKSMCVFLVYGHRKFCKKSNASII